MPYGTYSQQFKQYRMKRDLGELQGSEDYRTLSEYTAAIKAKKIDRYGRPLKTNNLLVESKRNSLY